MDQRRSDLLVEKFTTAIDESAAADGVLHQDDVIAALTQVMATTIMTIPDAAGPANARRIADMVSERIRHLVAKDASAPRGSA
jgi:hypothetical protein